MQEEKGENRHERGMIDLHISLPPVKEGTVRHSSPCVELNT